MVTVLALFRSSVNDVSKASGKSKTHSTQRGSMASAASRRQSRRASMKDRGGGEAVGNPAAALNAITLARAQREQDEEEAKKKRL